MARNQARANLLEALITANSFEVPPVTDLALIKDLLQPTATVGIFAYILAMSIVRTMALKFEYATDANQELVAFGFANIAGAFFSGYPAGEGRGSRVRVEGGVEGAGRG